MPACKPSTQIIPATFAWSLLIFCSAIFFGCASEGLVTHYSPLIIIYVAVLTVFVVSNFALATAKDPGIYPRAHDDEANADNGRAPLYKNTDIKGISIRMKWCQTCRFYRPPRCSHCSVCNHCIEVFDHHCPWVNNCIGRRNYRYFFQFLLSLTLDMVSIFAFSLLHVISNASQLATAQNILLIVIIVIIGLLLIPVAGLAVFHVVLVSRGKTTNEQMTGKLKGGLNPYTKGCFRNCFSVFCGPVWPKLTDYASKTSSVDIDSLRLVYRMSGNVNKVYMESKNGLHKNGVHAGSRTFSSSGLITSNNFDFLPSVSKQYNRDMEIPLGGSAHSLTGQAAVGLGMVGLSQKTYSTSSFPLVNPLSSSTHSLISRPESDHKGHWNAPTFHASPKRNVAPGRPTTGSVGSLSGAAAMGHGMLGFPGKPFETNIPPQRPSRKQTVVRSAQASSTKSLSSSAAGRALSASPVSHRSQRLASDQKYPRKTVHAFRDSIDSVQPSSEVQLTPAVSGGHGALGLATATWGSLAPAAAVGVRTSVGAKEATTSSRTRHRREAGLSGSRERVGRASVKVPSATTRMVEPPKRASHPQHPVPVAVPNIPGSVRRPMSFVKALEVSDKLSVVEQQWNRDRPRQQGLSPQAEEELQNVLEISV